MPSRALSVGDRVRCIDAGRAYNTSLDGLTGTVLAIHDNMIGVCWDKPIRAGHDLHRTAGCPPGRGWYIARDNTERLPDEIFDPCPEEDLLSILAPDARTTP